MYDHHESNRKRRCLTVPDLRGRCTGTSTVVRTRALARGNIVDARHMIRRAVSYWYICKRRLYYGTFLDIWTRLRKNDADELMNTNKSCFEHTQSSQSFSCYNLPGTPCIVLSTLGVRSCNIRVRRMRRTLSGKAIERKPSTGLEATDLKRCQTTQFQSKHSLLDLCHACHHLISSTITILFSYQYLPNGSTSNNSSNNNNVGTQWLGQRDHPVRVGFHHWSSIQAGHSKVISHGRTWTCGDD